MKIRTELFSVIAVVFTFIVIAQVILLENVKSNQSESAVLRQVAQQELIMVYELESFYQRYLESWKNVLLRGHQNNKYHFYLSKFYQYERSLSDTLNALLKIDNNSAELDSKLTQLKSIVSENGKAYRSALDKYFETEENPHIAADQFEQQELVVTEMIDNVKQFVVKAQSNITQDYDEKNVAKLNNTILLTVIIALICSGFILLLMRSRIVKPLEQAVAVAQSVQRDDSKLRMNVSGNNEIAAFSQAFNQMLDAQTDQHEQLQLAIFQLAEAEKMAALGGLVAGVAHELNTPIGNSLTAATVIKDLTGRLSKNIETNSLSRSDLDNFILQLRSSYEAIERNIYRANDLIGSFKQVAVDQSSERRRKFDVKECIEEVLSTLYPKIKHTHHTFNLESEHILMDSYPGPLGQVITNLVSNSLLHGFQDIVMGKIEIEVSMQDNNHIKIVYQDNGVGILPSITKKVFEPFFTTAADTLGSGLGMNIVYNIVTRLLGGTIELESELNQFTRFIIVVPNIASNSETTPDLLY